MSYRQDQKFTLETKIESRGIVVPPAVFHTLIENALTHNRYSKNDSKFFLVQKQLDDKRAEFTLVTPQGDSDHKTDSKAKTGGLGLSYVRARLEESWGNNFTFSDGKDDAGGWRSVLVVPIELLTEVAE